MQLKFDPNCISEGSRIAYCLQVKNILLLKHNIDCEGMGAREAYNYFHTTFFPRQVAIVKELNINRKIARQSSYWNIKLADHFVNDTVKYPFELNLDNEGSLLSFLYGLRELLGDDPTIHGDWSIELEKARNKAIGLETYWQPNIQEVFE